MSGLFASMLCLSRVYVLKIDALDCLVDYTCLHCDAAREPRHSDRSAQ